MPYSFTTPLVASAVTFEGDYAALSSGQLVANNGMMLVNIGGALTWVDIATFLAAALGLGAESDGSKLVYNHAQLKIMPEIVVGWTPDNSVYGRWWFKCYNDTTFTVNGSNQITGATNQITAYVGSYNISTVDAGGELKEMGPGPGVGTVPGWKFIKANNCYMTIPNGVYQANPASFMVAWQSGSTLSLDTLYILVVTYDGTTATVWLDGVSLLSFAVSASGVGASDLMLGAQDTGGGWGQSYNFAGFLYNICLLSSHLSTERQKVEGYMAWQHGISGSLQPSHPYKFTPPAVA